MLKEDLLNHYGPTMSIKDLAEVLHISTGAIHNRLSQKNFRIPCVKIYGRWMAQTSDVAKFIDETKLIKEAE
jgi:hypothetical protein